VLHRPKKWLGQNFLRDDTVVQRIVDAVDPATTDVVIEIGPGQGALTEKLLDSGADVIAIEFDQDLILMLEERFGRSPRFRLISQDALRTDFAEIVDEPAKLVANLPYNISTPILQRLMEQRHLFSKLVLMFQREVIERITAKPGSSDRGFLTVLVENAFDVDRLFDVPPTAFRPVPKVWSAVVRLTPKGAAVPGEAFLRKLVSAAFAQRRKTLQNNLKGFIADPAMTLAAAGIDPSRRAQSLSLAEWNALASEANRH
jgi:16S rRNA (adenine1518-N6/adenine1519-N6)-dimethyltransferase